MKILAIAWSIPAETFIRRIVDNSPDGITWQILTLNSEETFARQRLHSLRRNTLYVIYSTINIFQLWWITAIRNKSIVEKENELSTWFASKIGSTYKESTATIEGIWHSTKPSKSIYGYPFETWLNKIIQQTRLFRKLISEDQPDIVLLSEENILHGAEYYTQICRDLGIPVVVYNYTNGVHQEFIAYFQKRRGIRQRISKYIGKLSWKKYNFQLENGEVLTLPLYAQALSELSQEKISEPWAGYCGLADLYLVASNAERFECQRANIPETKIEFIESIEVTSIMSLRGVQNEPLIMEILVLLPPNQFEGGKSKLNAIFESYEELIDSMIQETQKAITQNQVIAKLTFALHPRTHHQLVYFKNKFPGVNFSVADITKDLATASMLVSYGSGINDVAINLGISVLNWDVYGYGYTWNGKKKQIIEAKTISDYQRELKFVLSKLESKVPIPPLRKTTVYQSLSRLITNK